MSSPAKKIHAIIGFRSNGRGQGIKIYVFNGEICGKADAEREGL
jgi:hypothetical protein